jgi:hypothetical protein
VYSGPSFIKPTHGYGQPFGECESPADTESEEDENWAGEGFTKPYEEPE